jgi:uncharacterized membrane protein
MKRIARWMVSIIFVLMGAICLVSGYEHKEMRKTMYPCGMLLGMMAGVIWPTKPRAY